MRNFFDRRMSGDLQDVMNVMMEFYQNLNYMYKCLSSCERTLEQAGAYQNYLVEGRQMVEEIQWMLCNLEQVAEKCRQTQRQIEYIQSNAQMSAGPVAQLEKEEQRKAQEVRKRELDARDAALARERASQEAREQEWQASKAYREQQTAAWKQEEEEQRKRLEHLRQEVEAAEEKLASARQRCQTLEERERDLTLREQRLADREAALLREGSVREDRSQTLAALGEIQTAMLEVQRTIRQLGPGFNAVTERVNGGFLSGGLCNLIRCCRSLRQARTKEADYYAQELEWILVNDFGCERFQPVTGTPFDPLLMVRQDVSAAGDRVACTVNCGWRMGDHILEKAVITPATEV